MVDAKHRTMASMASMAYHEAQTSHRGQRRNGRKDRLWDSWDGWDGCGLRNEGGQMSNIWKNDETCWIYRLIDVDLRWFKPEQMGI